MSALCNIQYVFHHCKVCRTMDIVISGFSVIQMSFCIIHFSRERKKRLGRERLFKVAIMQVTTRMNVFHNIK